MAVTCPPGSSTLARRACGRSSNRKSPCVVALSLLMGKEHLAFCFSLAVPTTLKYSGLSYSQYVEEKRDFFQKYFQPSTQHGLAFANKTLLLTRLLDDLRGKKRFSAPPQSSVFFSCLLGFQCPDPLLHLSLNILPAPGAPYKDSLAVQRLPYNSHCIVPVGTPCPEAAPWGTNVSPLKSGRLAS